jgi:hypothetical protein
MILSSLLDGVQRNGIPRQRCDEGDSIEGDVKSQENAAPLAADRVLAYILIDQ